MTAREHELLAQVDERELVAIAEHRLYGVRIKRAEIGLVEHGLSTSALHLSRGERSARQSTVTRVFDELWRAG
jgi:hypothetical protein